MQKTIRHLWMSPEIIQLSFGVENANTYLIVVDNHAVVVDVCSSEVVHELLSRNLIVDYTILTHEHCDHLWGLNSLKKQFPQMKVIAQEKCSYALPDSSLNKAKQYRIYAALRYGISYQNEEAMDRNFQCAPADVTFKNDYQFSWRGIDFNLVHTSGHSPGSSMIFAHGIGVFSGDVMIQNEETFLLFAEGNQREYEIKTVPVLESIQDDLHVFPGHGDDFDKRNWR